MDEHRDPAAAGALARRLSRGGAGRDRPVRVMEVCGGHTHTIYRHGLPDLLPEAVEMVHGPGCPVCVVPRGRLDEAVALALDHGVTLCTYGDLMRVPGSRGSLLAARSEGADVRVVYSPLDALEVARSEPDRQVAFLAIGFETTAPATAVTVARAAREGLTNFSVLCFHVRVVPPLRALLSKDDGGDPAAVDALVAPGHVAMVIGAAAYQPLVDELAVPVVVAGFEPLDVLSAITMAVEDAVQGRARLRNQYTRVVTDEGNPSALALMDEVFEVRDTFEWRGLGEIPHSAHRLSERYRDLDAEHRFGLEPVRVPDHRACRCAEVLRGRLHPWECRVFGTACTPEHPLGSCMVSSEGACAAVYLHGRRGTRPRVGLS